LEDQEFQLRIMARISSKNSVGWSGDRGFGDARAIDTAFKMMQMARSVRAMRGDAE
jgi:hypothetical protein